MKRALVVVAAIAVAVVSNLAFAFPTEAHEQRTVGPYQFVVGWLNEPSFVATANAVSLVVTDVRNTPPTPVERLETTLRVEVFQGGLTTPFASTFRARFGVPGAYAADIVPTRTGSYRFVISGTIGDLRVDETFESGPGRFAEIGPQTALQYPDQVPTGAELTTALQDIRGLAEQVRVLAAVAILIGVAALLLSVSRSRRT